MNTKIKDYNINQLNSKYNELTIYQRVEQLYIDFEPKDIMLTSSFAATSAFLLKVISDINKDQIIYFINTGYHFKETLIYRNYLEQLYDLKIVDVTPNSNDHDETLKSEMWKSKPNECCNINKVEPLKLIQKNYKIWISGLMRWQSDYRSSLNIFEERETILKFYPLLDIDYIERDNFIKQHHLPFHPLKSKGYSSIGCSHCTVPGENRTGRWNNSPKTECGLHL